MKMDQKTMKALRSSDTSKKKQPKKYAEGGAVHGTMRGGGAATKGKKFTVV